MKSSLLSLSFLALALLSGCAVGPSFSVKVQTPHGETTRPIARLPANVKGDMVFTGQKLTVTTPRNADGSIAIERRAILNKARTAVLGYDEIPVVAEVDVSGPIESMGRAISTGIRAAGSLVGTVLSGMVGLGAANAAGQGAAAVVHP